jgi:hypothetical protein
MFDPWDCVGFVADLVSEAKETLVSVDGIGSDLAPAVFAFGADGVCLGWAQMESGSMDLDDQFERLAGVSALLRSGWHCFGVLFCVEGFVHLGGGAGGDVSLVELFAAGDRDVEECLSLVYGDEFGEVLVCSLPYRQELGRRVVWTGGGRENVENDSGGSFVFLLERLFEFVDPVPWPDGVSGLEAMGLIGERLVELGFSPVFGVDGDGWVF